MKSIFKPLILAISVLCINACTNSEQYYEKHVVFPDDATPEQKIDLASRLIPSKQQMEWQKMEFTCFLHFGINTFTGKEWGDGKEDPALFNPSELDCDQWVRALKDAGFKMAIITAKHHDGFCLWPTETTEHSVKASPWKNGKGDVVRELKDACQRHGLKFGVYLSPWDRNAECYGQGEPYNKFFIAQLTELLSNYGEVHEVWFDGANGEGPNGKKQIYDWNAILSTIRKLQPKAVTAIMGDDVRWVGNEGGLGRDTEWSATVIAPGSYTDKQPQNEALGVHEMAKDLGSRELVAKAKEMFWYPSEVDVSIRPGWFYHAEQDSQVRPLANLVNIYFRSVGCNSVLLLNIPPDRRGLLHETDVQRIKELHSYVNETFSKNLLTKGFTSWSGTSGKSKVFDIQKNTTFNTLLIQEDILKGQRIEGFKAEILKDGQWKQISEGTTVGYKRILRFSDMSGDKLRFTITASRGEANLSNIGLFFARHLNDNASNVRTSDIPTEKWSSTEKGTYAAFDGNIATAWKSEGLVPLEIDLGEELEINGFCYAPVRSEDISGTIYKYRFMTSVDGSTWTECITSGEFSNIKNNPIPYFTKFDKKISCRWIRLIPLEEINGKNLTSVGEIGIIL